jgi:uncharacterized membrane protein YedE/YeeE
MTIDWLHFTPWASLAGGLVLGLATALFMLVHGRILGISGILGGLIVPGRSDTGWRVAFVLGLVAAPVVSGWLAPEGWARAPRIDASPALIVLAGVLVGLGTRYAAGCTSGHGICGLSRLSPLSLVATACFMAAGFAVVFVMRHLVGGA